MASKKKETLTKEEKPSLREIFVREFVKILIKSCKPEEIELDEEALNLHAMQESLKQPIPRKPGQIRIVRPAYVPRTQTPLQSPPQKPVPSKTPIRRTDTPETIMGLPQQSAYGGFQGGISHGLDTIRTLLDSTSVSGIECIGPNKNLLINRGGSVEASSIKLSPEELKEIAIRNLKNKPITKIIAVLQNIDNEEIWNLTCITKGLAIIKLKIKDSNSQLLESKDASLFDVVKRVK